MEPDELIPRDKLIPLVSTTLAKAMQFGDQTIVLLMQAFAQRLVQEVQAEKVREAMAAMAEDNGAPSPVPCPVCEARKKKLIEAQRRYRQRQRERQEGKDVAAER